MNKIIFFGLVRKKGIDPLANAYGFGAPEYELYLVNNSDNPITVKNKSFGGFKTFDDEVATLRPQEDEVEILIEPHGYVLYDELYEENFDGAGQCQAVVEIEGSLKNLEIYFSRGVGFLGSLIPCVNKLGRVIHPRITEV
jgi:hypothetical protein